YRPVWWMPNSFPCHTIPSHPIPCHDMPCHAMRWMDGGRGWRMPLIHSLSPSHPIPSLPIHPVRNDPLPVPIIYIYLTAADAADAADAEAAAALDTGRYGGCRIHSPAIPYHP